MKVGNWSAIYLRNSKLVVAVNDVAETTFVPFANTSALVPFHLIATFASSVIKLYSEDEIPLSIFQIFIR